MDALEIGHKQKVMQKVLEIVSVLDSLSGFDEDSDFEEDPCFLNCGPHLL